MSRAERFDALSQQFAEQYRGLLSTITGLFARTLDSHDPTTPKARGELHHALQRAHDTFMTGVSGQIETVTHALKDAAQSDLGIVLSVPDQSELDGYLDETVADLRRALSACAARDDQAAERELRNLSLNVSLIQARGTSKIGALIKAKFGRVRSLSFVQRDSLGRKRASEAFVMILVRRHLVLTDIETRLFTLAKSGFDLAQVQQEDGTPGETFSITGTTPGYPSYEEIRDRIFHPNSTATVVARQE